MYYVNYETFEKLALDSNTEKSHWIKYYFIEIRKFLVKYKDLIYNTISEKKELLEK